MAAVASSASSTNGVAVARHKQPNATASTKATVHQVLDSLDAVLGELRDSTTKTAQFRQQCAETEELIAQENRRAAAALVEHPATLSPPRDVVDGAAFRELKNQLDASQHKVQQLTKNLVKALKDRNDLDDKAARLTDVVVRLTDELTAAQALNVKMQDIAVERDVAFGDAAAMKDMLAARDATIATLKNELRQRTAAFEKLSVNAREQHNAIHNEKEAVLSQITQQMVDLVAEHEAVVEANEDMYSACDKAADELRLALRRGMELEQRAETAERSLNALQLQMQREASAAQLESTGGTGLAVGLAAADLAAAKASATRAEERLAIMTSSRDIAEAKSAELEAHVRTLKRQLAGSAREATSRQIEAQALRNELARLQEEARYVTSLMQVTRADVERMYECAAGNVEVEQFVDRTAMDLINCARFLGRVRSAAPTSVGSASPAAAPSNSTSKFQPPTPGDTTPPPQGSGGTGAGATRQQPPVLAVLENYAVSKRRLSAPMMSP